MRVVTGASDHLGWAELVTLALRHEEPVILDRRRVRLVAADLPSAPYHHEGLELPRDQVEPLLAATRSSLMTHSRLALEAVRDSLGVTDLVIQESPYPSLPDSLEEVLASRHLTCAADGMLYREELVTQARSLGLEVHRFPRKEDPLEAASRALGCSVEEVVTRLDQFGRQVGAPWRKEHRRVAAAALGVLCADPGGDRGSR